MKQISSISSSSHNLRHLWKFAMVAFLWERLGLLCHWHLYCWMAVQKTIPWTWVKSEMAFTLTSWIFLVRSFLLLCFCCIYLRCNVYFYELYKFIIGLVPVILFHFFPLWSYGIFLVACSTLAKIPNVLVIHGEGDSTVEHMKV